MYTNGINTTLFITYGICSNFSTFPISPLFISLQWGTILFDGSTTEKNITLPINFSIILGFSTFAYGQGVHSVFGGYHQPPNGISMYRKSFFAENVNCIWLGVFK